MSTHFGQQTGFVVKNEQAVIDHVLNLVNSRAKVLTGYSYAAKCSTLEFCPQVISRFFHEKNVKVIFTFLIESERFVYFFLRVGIY